MKWQIKRNLVAWAMLTLALSVPGAGAQPAPPDDAAVLSLLRQRVEVEQRCVGIAAGIIDGQGRRVVTCGSTGREQAGPLSGDTVFEIGSVTKVFTSLALARLAELGEVNLDDPVATCLPPGTAVPQRDGRAITLLDLAAQRSGLPRLPGNFAPQDGENPYADYSVEQLYAFLAGHSLARAPGAAYEYSNLGAGLLGLALAAKRGTDYESLISALVCQPLGMASTSIRLSPEQLTRLAAGHNALGYPAKNWDIPALAGAGALRSTVNDMLIFLAAHLGLSDTPLTAAMRQTHLRRGDAGQDGMDIGLGWHILNKRGTAIVWHNGETGGYHSFVGFVPEQRRGVVLLANSACNVDDIGFRLLDSKAEVNKHKPLTRRTAVQLDQAAGAAVAGEYEFAPGVMLTIRHEGGRLLARVTGQPELQLFPESANRFFYQQVDAQISFVKDASGRVISLVLHQNGAGTPAVKKQ